MKALLLVVVALGTLLQTGCSKGPKSSYGFTLPDGDPANGLVVFKDYSCHECHTVQSVELPEIATAIEKRIALGGKVTRIQTYGELVTSIINPSHRLARGYTADEVAENGKSKMTNYNDIMTVSELIDLVAFLQSKYKLMPYEPSPYELYQFGP